MVRNWILPAIMLIFASLSVLILRSVAPSLLSKQLLYFFVGGLLFLGVSRVPFVIWEKYAAQLYGVLIFLLVLTQLIGRVTRGATSWIPLGPFHIQASQLSVLVVGILLAKKLAEQPVRSISRLIWFAGVVLLPALLIFLEPDLGMVVIYMASMAVLFVVAETKWRYILGGVASALLFMFIAWQFLLHPYQKQRITSFIDVSAHSSSGSYNAIQSVIAVGSGQVYGRGLGQGVQSHLRFLPERQTDFVFASLAEEMGIIGSGLVIGLFAALALFVIWVSLQRQRRPEQYFCLITAGMITVQASINIGMNMGVLPITGITLPLVSYGGSSILSLCIQYGVIQSMVRFSQPHPKLEIR